MSFDTSPSRLEAAFVQRDITNSWYEQINISGSDLIIYLDEYGKLNADKVSVWVTKYGIGVGVVPGGSYNITTSYSSASLSSSYSKTASIALNGVISGWSYNITTSYSSASRWTIYATHSIFSTQSLYSTQSIYSSQSLFSSQSISASYASIALTASYALNAESGGGVTGYAQSFMLMGG